MINPETEIAGSSFDKKTRTHSYTIERGGRRWTVRIHDNDFLPKTKAQRRQHLTNALESAMRGPADGE